MPTPASTLTTIDDVERIVRSYLNERKNEAAATAYHLSVTISKIVRQEYAGQPGYLGEFRT